MKEKSVVASMSNEIILSIEDLEREGSKKLPSFKRGKPPLFVSLIS
jgi:(S)-2-hydroxy-acid oxidase